MTLAELRGVSRTYGSGESAVHALSDVTLRLDAGDHVAVVGPSGSGKSTLLHVVGMVDTPTAGEYVFEGKHVGRMSDAERTRMRLHRAIRTSLCSTPHMVAVLNVEGHRLRVRGGCPYSPLHRLGFVFQQFFLLPILTARENVELPLREAGVPRAERRARAEALLARVGLRHRLGHSPNTLSGGEQQRVAIARALANKPALLLADEPTGELDSAMGAQIMDLFDEINHEGTAILMVTHDASVAARARRVVHMRDGRVEKVVVKGVRRPE